MINWEKLSGVWSAAPTPLTEKMEVDIASVERMMEHHRRLGINGLFLLGTNGEGPWLPERHRRTLVRKVVEHNKGKMLIAVQVTDNSAARMLENVKLVEEDGADIAVTATFSTAAFWNRSATDVKPIFLDAIRRDADSLLGIRRS